MQRSFEGSNQKLNLEKSILQCCIMGITKLLINAMIQFKTFNGENI